MFVYSSGLEDMQTKPQYPLSVMKTLVKKASCTSSKKQAQCCAKVSTTVAGCHD